MSERHGIEIDYCPKCRGVWLDRGELDKIIERASEEITRAKPASPASTRQPAPPPNPDLSMYDSDYGKYQYKRRKSWLSELFD
jgi:Zn-finger nucleic acid-binding protein